MRNNLLADTLRLQAFSSDPLAGLRHAPFNPSTMRPPDAPDTAQAQTALDKILQSKVLNVAVQTDSALYGFVGTDLKPIGLDVDMATFAAVLSEWLLLLIGVGWTLALTFASVMVCILLLRLGKAQSEETVVATYVQVFQGVPLLVQLLLAYCGFGLCWPNKTGSG